MDIELIWPGITKFEAEHPEYLDYVKGRGRFEDHSLTGEEALELMELASMDPDKSRRHMVADNIMLDLLRGRGLDEICDVRCEMDVWYD